MQFSTPLVFGITVTAEAFEKIGKTTEKCETRRSVGFSKSLALNLMSYFNGNFSETCNLNKLAWRSKKIRNIFPKIC